MEEDNELNNTSNYYGNEEDPSKIWKIISGALFIVVIILGLSLILGSNGDSVDELDICNTNLEASKSNLVSTSQELQGCNAEKTECFSNLETCLNPVEEVIITGTEENVTDTNVTIETNVTDTNITDTNITGETNDTG